MADQSKKTQRMSFGMDKFDAQEFDQWGRSVRVAMALVSGPPLCDDDCDEADSASSSRLPTEPDAIYRRLNTLVRDQSANLADQVELPERFDEQRGWADGGYKHCVAWMNVMQPWTPALYQSQVRMASLWIFLARAGNGLPHCHALFITVTSIVSGLVALRHSGCTYTTSSTGPMEVKQARRMAFCVATSTMYCCTKVATDSSACLHWDLKLVLISVRKRINNLMRRNCARMARLKASRKSP